MMCEAIAESGHEITVYTTTANGSNELDVVPGKAYIVDKVHVIYYKRLTGDHSHWSPALLKALWNTAKNFDVVHIQSWWNTVSIASMAICKILGINTVLSLRGTMSNFTFEHSKRGIKKIFHSILGKQLLNDVLLHVTSEKELSEVSVLTSKQRIFLIPNILSLPSDPIEAHFNGDYFKMIFVGRIHSVKNLEWFFHVIKKLDFNYQLTIVGTGDPTYVQQLKDQSKCLSVVWKGNMDGDEKYKLLVQSDLLVLPSLTENFGNVIFESLSQGTPVLVSDQVGGKDYVEKNGFGWALPLIEDVWVSALTSIKKDSSSRDQIRYRSVMQVAKDFNKNRQVAQYCTMYESHSQRRN
jgi:glycosyltransferase involved in cell wall biosynthesis